MNKWYVVIVHYPDRELASAVHVGSGDQFDAMRAMMVKLAQSLLAGPFPHLTSYDYIEAFGFDVDQPYEIQQLWSRRYDIPTEEDKESDPLTKAIVSAKLAAQKLATKGGVRY